MGVKFLNLQTVSWCFQAMADGSSCLQLPEQRVHDPSATMVKLVRSDGIVKVYRRPVRASELMIEFPKHLICHSESFRIGRKIPTLVANEELRLGHTYFLLPNHFFLPVLSFVSLASLVSSSNKVAKKNVRGHVRPFDILKTPEGSLQIKVSDEFISTLIVVEECRTAAERYAVFGEELEEEEDRRPFSDDQPHGRWPTGKVCTTPELQKHYTQLVASRSQQWKPKLATIRESEKILSRFGGALGMERRKRWASRKKLQRLETM